jgi:hypothetical protein
MECSCLRFIDFVSQIEPALRKGDQLVLTEILKKIKFNITRPYYENNKENVDKILLIIKESSTGLSSDVQLSITQMIEEIYHKLKPEEVLQEPETSVFRHIPRVKMGINLTQLVPKAQKL